jgi:hypothetical protein
MLSSLNQDILVSVRNEDDEAIGEYPIKFTGHKTVHASVYSKTVALFCESLNGDKWNITHLPTGLHIMQVCGTREQAESIVQILLAVDWQFGEFGSPLLLEKMGVEVKKVFIDAWSAAKVLGSSRRSQGASSAPSPASALGRLGGQARTPAKAHAARSNGKKGGRPKRDRDTSAFD